MAVTIDGRQTVLREFLRDFPFYVSTGSGKTHYVHEDDAPHGLAGTSYCGRFNVSCTYPRTRLEVLNAARNPCLMCLRRMSDEHLDTVAVMASACSQHEITRHDIRANE